MLLHIIARTFPTRNSQNIGAYYMQSHRLRYIYFILFQFNDNLERHTNKEYKTRDKCHKDGL